MKTTIINESKVERSWYVIDAKDQNVGRIATRIATVLRGKHKPTFSLYVDGGDYVIVTNIQAVNFTGSKMDTKEYHRYSGYSGGLRSQSAREVLASHPERVLYAAVKGMLPKNRLSRQVIKKLKLYASDEHPHAAQNPQPFPSHV
jgi:large subunit ribosomal protein L13